MLWTRCFHRRQDARYRLFCFPHAAGAASFFRQWRHPALEIWAVQYPGREDRLAESMPDQLTQVAANIARAMQAQLDRPYILLGHSMGACIAFEVARALARQRAPSPTGLIVSAHEAPQHARQGKLHTRPDPELRAELERLNGTRNGVFDQPELLHLVLSTMRLDYRLIEGYRLQAGPILTCPILACWGDADPEVCAGKMREWAIHTSARYSSRSFPGDHFYLTEHREALLHHIATECQSQPSNTFSCQTVDAPYYGGRHSRPDSPGCAN